LFPLIGTIGTLLLGYYLKSNIEDENGAANTIVAAAAEHQEMSIKKDNITTF